MNRSDGALYVDIDRLSHVAFRGVAARAGLETDVATSADAAVDLARKRSYAIVAIEYSIAAADGLALIERISKMQSEAAILLIVQDHDLVLPRTQGASLISEIIFKPWTPASLFNGIRRARMLNSQLVATRFVSMAEPSPGQPARVLVVIDEPAEAQLVQMALDPDDHIFESVRVGRLDEALEALQKHKFDLVIIDLSLPDARGLTSVVMIRDVAADVPLIVLSGLVSEVVATQAVQIGADDLLVKGDVSVAQLARAARFAIERRRARRRYASHRSLAPVTGLPNDTAFYLRLSEMLEDTRGHRNTVGVLLIEIPDAAADDILLHAASIRLRTLMRAADFVAYLGHAQFGIVVTLDDEGEQLERTADYVKQCLELSYRLEAGDVHADANIAIAQPTEQDDPSEVIAKARRALVDVQRRQA